jgi:hypothetical protein
MTALSSCTGEKCWSCPPHGVAHPMGVVEAWKARRAVWQCVWETWTTGWLLRVWCCSPQDDTVLARVVWSQLTRACCLPPTESATPTGKSHHHS